MDFKIIEILSDIKSMIDNKSSNRWMDMKEVCDYSGLSSSTIHRFRKKGILKASTSTGKLLFKISDVDKWLNG